jgi:hypothetical protein
MPYDVNAYQNAIARRIAANRRTGGARRFRARDPQLAATLLDNPSDAVRRAVPEFLWEALYNWGGLTERQAEVARAAIERADARRAERAQADATRAASATPWTAGRQVVTGRIVFAKHAEHGVAYNVTAVSIKVTLETETGAKLYGSLPKNVLEHENADEVPDEWVRALVGATLTMTTTVAPKDGDPTFAFGSRPSHGTLTRGAR